MTNRDVEASDADLAEQALPAMAGDEDEEFGEELPDAEISLDGDANPADVIEQHQGVPLGEDDYDR